MTEKLKGCPFCGGKPKVYETLKRYVDDKSQAPLRKVWRVMCGARVDCCTLLNEFETEEEAAHAWNRRVCNA